MNNVKELRVVGKMTFPHFVQLEHNSITSKKITVKEWSDKTKSIEEVEKIVKVMKDGTIDIVFDPEKPVIKDDLVHTVNATYKVIEMIDTHQAKGDWSFADITPVWGRFIVKFHS